MLHLFNKIYVCNDFLIDNSRRRIIISRSNNVASSLVKHGVEKFSDLVGPNGIFNTWKQLLDSLEYDAGTRFYVDMEGFNHIYVHWIKTLFKDISADTAFCCYNTYVQRLKLHFPAMIIKKSVDQNKILNLKFLSKKDFTELFSSTDAWSNDSDRIEWINKHKEGVSIEWHMANYFNDETHLEVFKQKYLFVLTRALAIEVSEWYFYVIKYFMQPNVKNYFDINIKWDDENWREILKAHPSLGWMFDNELKFMTRDEAFFLAHIDEILELGKCLQDFWFKDITIDDKIRLLDEDFFESDHAHFVFDTLKTLIKNQDNLTAEEMNKIIKKDFEKENVSIVFDVLTHVQKWNPYLLQFIYELKNTQDPRLKELVIK